MEDLSANENVTVGANLDSIAELSLEEFLAIKEKRSVNVEPNVSSKQANKNKWVKEVGPNPTKRLSKAQLGKGTKVHKLALHQA